VEPSLEGELDWRPLVRDDLPLLGRWLAEPGVARWWNHETSPEAVERDFGPSVRGEEPGEDLVLLLAGRPVGLLQRSRICDYAEDLVELSAVVDVPEDAYSLDYLLGRAGAARTRAGEQVHRSRRGADLGRPPGRRVHPGPGRRGQPRRPWRALEKAGLRRGRDRRADPGQPGRRPRCTTSTGWTGRDRSRSA
jgi:aminoglycoside 6'-N-acetyltransferase